MNEVIAAMGGDRHRRAVQVARRTTRSVPTIYFHHTEEDMRYALRQPFVSIGSDGTAVKTEGPLARGNPHPRYYGTFPRVLGRYVRDEKVLTLEEAIRKMTSANAAKIGIYDRGLLRTGYVGRRDGVQSDTMIDNSTWEKPHQYASGIELRDRQRPGGAGEGRAHQCASRQNSARHRIRTDGSSVGPGSGGVGDPRGGAFASRAVPGSCRPWRNCRIIRFPPHGRGPGRHHHRSEGTEPAEPLDELTELFLPARSSTPARAAASMRTRAQAACRPAQTGEAPFQPAFPHQRQRAGQGAGMAERPHGTCANSG